MANVARYREIFRAPLRSELDTSVNRLFLRDRVGFAWACVVERLRLMDRGTPDIERASNRRGIDRQVCL
jgi:hypothetical protein